MKSDPALSLRDPGAVKPYWKVFATLLLVALVAALAAVPFEMESLPAADVDVVWWSPFVAFLVWAVPSACAVAIGVPLGAKVGLGAPLVRGWIVGEAGLARRIRSLLLPCLIGGIGGCIVLKLVGPWFEKHLWPEMSEATKQAVEAATHITSWKMILASFAAGVCEELVFRLGLMTLIVWLGITLRRCQQPGTALLWTANLLAVVPFALIHLANAAGLGIPITFGLIIIILILNGAAGVIFGWLYARHGVEAAMLAHFLWDLVQFIRWPMVGSIGG